ncbi:MAG: hypothetical protein M1448_02520 [Candidatus Marsarchaeota archaeon]|jgi:hypothetical protein|nr:hypothetical protein [Candidatus Marsarchaeota archaeon]
MEPTSIAERKLRNGITAVVGEMNRELYGKDLHDENRAEEAASVSSMDTDLVGKLVREVIDQVNCRKTSEIVLRDELRDSVTEFNVRIGGDFFEYCIRRRATKG